VGHKLEELKKYISNVGAAAIAFSGGVDSTFLLKVASEAAPVIAVTARSLSFPARELEEAKAFCARNGIRQFIVDSEELEIEGFSKNPPNRCYLCKSELFIKIKETAEKEGIKNVAEASNADDDGDYRPGLAAVRELGVLSPLREVGLTKAEIRAYSKEMGLATWNKQSFACLASRFPYGTDITPERLEMIDRAEQFLLDKGFKQTRVRFHDNLARIETDDFNIFTDKNLRDEIHEKFKEIGFIYICADLKGYRTGAMNETLEL
jgi:uncharacterized protein